ncbi:MAG: proline--tRNA ligase [Promethearchaeota archaeon]
MGKKAKESLVNSMKKLPDRESNFTDWLNAVLLRSDVLDYRYNLKGCGVWRGYGFKLRKLVMQIIRDLLDTTLIPHEEYLFPLLVPEPQFMKEAQYVKGFEDEVYWVTHGGLTPLAVKLAVRPTSETAIYPMFSLWVRSHQDLPLKTYQIVNIFRFEGKNTRPLIRVREVTTFKEAHTVHSSAKECENQIREAIAVYSEFFDTLGLSYIINRRPEWDKFPGADYTIAYDVIFPGRHLALQIGTVHNLGQTFSKTFDIKFENNNGKIEYAYQTCYGISERIIASVIGLHGDDNGMILPAHIAPIQIVIVPIIFKESEEELLKESKKLEIFLKKEDFRVLLDDRNLNPGSKYYYWELKGVPIRIEIGPKDIANKQVVLVRRDTNKKIKIANTEIELIKKIRDTFSEIKNNQTQKISNHTKKLLFRTKDLNEGLRYVEKDKGIVEIPFCGSEECASEIEKKVEKLKFLGIPARYLDFLDFSDGKLGKNIMNAEMPEKEEIFCVICSRRTNEYWTIGRSY